MRLKAQVSQRLDLSLGAGGVPEAAPDLVVLIVPTHPAMEAGQHGAGAREALPPAGAAAVINLGLKRNI
jgi:hypothetical protein